MWNIFQEMIQEHKERLDLNYPLDLIDHYLVRMEEEKENKFFSGINQLFKLLF